MCILMILHMCEVFDVYIWNYEMNIIKFHNEVSMKYLWKLSMKYPIFVLNIK